MIRILELLKGAERVAILPHIGVDGDALGSCLAFAELVKAMGGNSTIYIEEEIPRNLLFMGGEFIVFDGKCKEEDVAVAIDCGDKERLAERNIIFEKAKQTICIDHHTTNEGYADINIIKQVAATAEIIYELICLSKITLTAKMAEFLLTAIITDTGGFRFSNTTIQSHKIAMELMSAGADNSRICTEVFESKSMGQSRLEAEAVSSMSLHHDGKTAIAVITKEMFEKSGAVDDDANNISSIIRSISGIITAVTIRERDDEIKVSMRSKEGINVARVCSHLGGGHMRAAGATMHGDILECAKKVEELMAKNGSKRCN